MTETRRKHMRNMCSERDESLTCGVNVPFGWVINGCVDSSLATSCQEFEPNSWTACAKMSRSTLVRVDASSSGVDMVLRERTAEVIAVCGVRATQNDDEVCIERGEDRDDEERARRVRRCQRCCL